MTVHKECYRIIIITWLIGFVLLWALFRFVPLRAVTYILSAMIIFFMGFIVFFSRVPRRKSVQGDNVVTSVADGEVVVLEKVYEPEYIKGECMQVSVYMTFFNVHVNFWPVSGEVSYYKYHPGKYMLAFLPKASELNEHSSMAVRSKYGEVFFKQLAGTFARRIVTYAEPGKKVLKGRQCGMIKFGSRIDMYLPLDADIKVKLGDTVFACESVIAELSKK